MILCVSGLQNIRLLTAFCVFYNRKAVFFFTETFHLMVDLPFFLLTSTFLGITVFFPASLGYS